jgi:hypothetical protein
MPSLSSSSSSSSSSLSSAASFSANLGLKYLCGVVSISKIENFHRTIFVALRNNCFFETMQIDQPFVDEKTVFIFTSIIIK